MINAVWILAQVLVSLWLFSQAIAVQFFDYAPDPKSVAFWALIAAAGYMAPSVTK